MENTPNCPVCGATTSFMATHPEAEIYHCSTCTHVFSDQKSLAQSELYCSDYFQNTHRNWFCHPNRDLFNWILAHIPRHASSLIDVGCGTGGFLKFLRTKRSGIRLTGIDLAANEDVDGIRFVQADALNTDLGEKFDVVVSQAVIEHVPNLQEFSGQLASLSNVDGYIFVMTLNNDSMLYVMARLLKKVGVDIAFNRLYSAHHVHHFTTQSLKLVLANAGLRVVAVHHHNAPLSAIDVPGTTPLLRGMLLLGVGMLFLLGSLFRKCYLQTVIAVPIPGIIVGGKQP